MKKEKNNPEESKRNEMDKKNAPKKIKPNTKGKVQSVDLSSITERVKPSSGRGLANEGTLTSYREER